MVFFCQQKTTYEMRISDWSSDVCYCDLIESRNARRPIKFVAGESIEIDVESRDVDCVVYYGLGSICEHRNAPFMGKPNNCLEWRQYPENIRHVRDRHKARAMRDGVRESGGIEIAQRGRIDPQHNDPPPFPKNKPRHKSC